MVNASGLLMACATYATRTLGYSALDNYVLSPRTKAILHADLTALGMMLVAANRPPMMATVAIAIIASAIATSCHARLQTGSFSSLRTGLLP